VESGSDYPKMRRSEVGSSRQAATGVRGQKSISLTTRPRGPRQGPPLVRPRWCCESVAAQPWGHTSRSARNACGNGAVPRPGCSPAILSVGLDMGGDSVIRWRIALAQPRCSTVSANDASWAVQFGCSFCTNPWTVQTAWTISPLFHAGL